MSKRTTKSAKSQADSSVMFEVISGARLQEMLKEQAKNAALALGVQLLNEEVEALCGTRHGRDGSCYRYGKERTNVTVGGARYSIERPRMRSGDGEREVYPETLGALRSIDMLDGEMHTRMLRGVSSRNYGEVIDGYSEKLGISKSSVSRAFIRSSHKELDAINGDDLSHYEFVALIVDGIEIAGTMVIAALGVTKDLEKIPVGLKEGDTEHAEVVKDLLTSVQGRGFTLYGERLLCIIDGSKALKKGIKQVFGKRAIIQRCWIHKLRNIKAYIPKEFHAQLRMRMNKMMGLSTLALAQTAYKELHKWLEGISYDAAQSLDEAGSELLAIHALGITGELRKSLTTTNAIESLFSVVRQKCRRVKNWKSSGTQQKMRWTAAAIKEHQRCGMRKLRGLNQRARLLEELSKPIAIDSVKKAA